MLWNFGLTTRRYVHALLLTVTVIPICDSLWLSTTPADVLEDLTFALVAGIHTITPLQTSTQQIGHALSFLGRITTTHVSLTSRMSIIMLVMLFR